MSAPTGSRRGPLGDLLDLAEALHLHDERRDAAPGFAGGAVAVGA